MVVFEVHFLKRAFELSSQGGECTLKSHICDWKLLCKIVVRVVSRVRASCSFVASQSSQSLCLCSQADAWDFCLTRRCFAAGFIGTRGVLVPQSTLAAMGQLTPDLDSGFSELRGTMSCEQPPGLFAARMLASSQSILLTICTSTELRRFKACKIVSKLEGQDRVKMHSCPCSASCNHVCAWILVWNKLSVST